MRVIVCGSRDWHDTLKIRKRIQALPETAVIITGGARGADEIAHAYALLMGMTTEVYPADWWKYGRAAGPRRNKKMLDSGADLVIAFRLDKDSRGTNNMIGIAKAASVPVEVVEP